MEHIQEKIPEVQKDRKPKRPNSLLRHEREKRGWSQSRLAELLDADPAMISRWETGVRKPESVYQEKLCKLFEKDAVELGFIEKQVIVKHFDKEITQATPGAEMHPIQIFAPTNTPLITVQIYQPTMAFPEIQHSEHTNTFLSEDLVVLFESMMLTQWNSYYTGGPESVIQGLNLFLKELERLVQMAQRTTWHGRTLRLLALGHQLQNCVWRDRKNYAQASIAYQKAFDIAQELEDIELLASALGRQGVALVQQGKPEQAILYLENALNIIDNQNLPKLRGYILQALSEANAQTQRRYECWSYATQAEEISLQAVQEQSLIRFNPASVVSQKGVDAVFLGDFKIAIELIDQGLKTYHPTGISGRARLTALKAEAYFELGMPDSCVESAEEALTLAQSVGSNKVIARIEKLHADLKQSEWKEEQETTQLSTMLLDMRIKNE